MKTNAEELYEIGLVIDEPGFKTIEGKIDRYVNGANNLGRISGNPFDDGVRKGEIDGIKYIQRMIFELRSELKKLKENQ